MLPSLGMPSSKLLLLSLFLPAFAGSSMVAACSSKSGDSATTSTDRQAVAAAFCEARRVHDGDCDPNTAPAQNDQCVAKDGPCIAITHDPGALATFNACMKANACKATGANGNC